MHAEPAVPTSPRIGGPAAAALCAVAALLTAGALTGPAADRDAAGVHVASPAGIPVVPNAGQSDARVRFEARGGGGAVFFTPGEAVVARPAGVVRVRFAGASPGATVRAIGRRDTIVNDLRGAGRAATGLPTYGAVAYAGLWPGVAVRLWARPGAGGPWPVARFEVAPGADLRAAR